jgi:hypothetical protein
MPGWCNPPPRCRNHAIEPEGTLASSGGGKGVPTTVYTLGDYPIAHMVTAGTLLPSRCLNCLDLSVKDFE